MRKKLQQPESVFLVITSSVAIDGIPARPGTLVELTEDEAKPLLRRGKARLATAEDMPHDAEEEAAAAAAAEAAAAEAEAEAAAVAEEEAGEQEAAAPAAGKKSGKK